MAKQKNNQPEQNDTKASTRHPLGTIKSIGFTSIQITPEQHYAIWPPEPGNGLVCEQSCCHLGCNNARRDAQELCPECGGPIGYGGQVPVNTVNILTSRGEMIWARRGMLLMHATCHEKLLLSQPEPK